MERQAVRSTTNLTRRVKASSRSGAAKKKLHVDTKYIFVSSDEQFGWFYWYETSSGQPRFQAIENFNIGNVDPAFSVIKMADLVAILPI